MKMTNNIAALLLSTSTAFAGGLSEPIVQPPVTLQTGIDLSGFNGGLTKQVMCSNVPARSGSVTGFSILGVGYFVLNGQAQYATAQNVYELPAGVHPFDEDEVNAFLEGSGLYNFEFVIRPNRDLRVVEETIIGEVVTVDSVNTIVTKPRGVADGSQHERDNLTSMGIAESDGANILRVRSTTEQTVYIRKAGGDTFSIEVGAGDTLVEVPSGGTYIAKFTNSERQITKATGNQPFPDQYGVQTFVETRTPTSTTVQAFERFSDDGEWCK
jgi:hypothetical protein